MGFERFLNSQNFYLWCREPKNNGPFLLKQLLFLSPETVNKCLWLRMAWMEMDCNLKN